MKCKKCGKEIPNTSIYCVFCGVRVRLTYFAYINDETDELNDEVEDENELEDLDDYELQDIDDDFNEELRKQRFRELEKLLFFNNNKEDEE